MNLVNFSHDGEIIEEDRHHDTTLETHPLNILFYLKKVDEESILEAFLLCVKYILKQQDKTNQRFLTVIYLEQWTLDLIPKEFYIQKRTAFKVFPLEEPSLNLQTSME